MKKSISKNLNLFLVLLLSMFLIDALELPFCHDTANVAIGCPPPPPPPPTTPPGGGGGPGCSGDCCSEGGGSGGSGGSGGGGGSPAGGFGKIDVGRDKGGIGIGGIGGGGTGGGGGGSGSCCENTDAADPINSSTGEFYVSVTDLYIEGPIPIAITRSYGNQRKYDSPYGYNWTINYDARIKSVDSTTLTYITDKAGTVEYSKVSANPDVYALPGNSSHYFEQTVNPAGFDMVVRNTGLTYHFTTAAGATYGRLKHIQDDHGHQVSFQHSSTTGFITKIQDTLGREVRFTYNSNYRLSRIYDVAGNRSWDYYYSTANDLATVYLPTTDVYSGANRLRFRYSYSSHNLTYAYDPQSNVLVHNYYTYDSSKGVYKAYRQDRAGGSHLFAYDSVNKVSTVTDPEGNVKKIFYNDLGLKTKEIIYASDPQATPNQYVTEYYHDALGRTVLKVLPAGNCIAYTFNSDNMITGVYRKTSPSDPSDPDHPNVSATLYEYDTVHYTKAATITDAMGNQTHYQYNANGQVTQITYPEIETPDGPRTAVEQFTYTATGKIDTYVNPDGVVKKHIYSPTTDFLLEEIEDYGQGAEFLNLTTTYTYDTLGRVIAKTSPDGAVTQAFYNSHDQVIKKISPSGYETLYAYDHNGFTKQIKRETSDPENEWQVTEYIRDQWGKVLTRKDALGNEKVYGYDKNERRNVVRDALDNETRYTYNERGLLAQITHPDDNHSTYAYDLNGNRIGVTDTSGNTTSYTYNDLDRVIRITDAEGHYRVRILDKNGRLLQEVAYDCSGTPQDTTDDVALMQTRYAYNEAGDLIQYVVLADASLDISVPVDANVDNVTLNAYKWAKGPMIQETRYYGGDGTNNANVAVTSHAYDGLGRRAQTEDPDGNLTNYYYNSAGQVARIQKLDINPIGDNILQTTDFVYDESGRLIQRIEKPQNSDALSDASWQTSEYVYDALDNMIQEIRPNGVVVTYAYDLLGRKIQMAVDPTGINQITEFGYDALGRQDWIAGYADSSNPNSRQLTEYDYDNLSRITKITYPDAAAIQYAYNDAGKVVSRTDPRGWITYYDYDDVYNMIEKEVTVGSVTNETFTYDGVGRMLSAQKQEGQDTVSLSRFAYSDMGPISDAWETIGTFAPKHIQYGHDNAGFRTQTVYPNTTVLNRTNHWSGKINTLKNGTNTFVEYAYAGDRVARRKSGSSIYFDPEYDNLGRMTRAYAYRMAGDPPVYTDITDFAYSYSPMDNNIEQFRFDHRPNTPYNQYDYDNLDRLTQADYLVGLLTEDEMFGMDDLGNRTTVNLRSGANQVYDVNDLTNRYMAVDSLSQNTFYDAAGNLIQDKDGYHYEYDYENRVTHIYKMNGQTPQTVARYAYDALGRRIWKHDPAAANVYYYYNDQWQILCEYTAETTCRQWFSYGNYIDEVLSSSPHPTLMLAMRYYTHDHLHNPAALTNASGLTVWERYEYDAYGKVTITGRGADLAWYTADDAMLTASAYHNPFTFTGRQLDILDGGNLHHMHYRYRDYSPELGRFMQHDPLGVVPEYYEIEHYFSPLRQFVDGTNLYNGYFAMQRGLDPMGTQAGMADLIGKIKIVAKGAGLIRLVACTSCGVGALGIEGACGVAAGVCEDLDWNDCVCEAMEDNAAWQVSCNSCFFPVSVLTEVEGLFGCDFEE